MSFDLESQTCSTEPITDGSVSDLANLERGYVGTISPQMRRFAQRQYRNAINFPARDGRRSLERIPILVPVLAVPVDQDCKLEGQAFDMLTRDVSEIAIGLIHAEKFDAQWLALEFEFKGAVKRYLTSRVWQDVMGPFYGSAMQFEDQLDTMPTIEGGTSSG